MLRKRFRNIFFICYTDSMKKKQIKGIDGIRALAIIGVTAFHFFPDLFKGGYMGVCLFFYCDRIFTDAAGKREIFYSFIL